MPRNGNHLRKDHPPSALRTRLFPVCRRAACATSLFLLEVTGAACRAVRLSHSAARSVTMSDNAREQAKSGLNAAGMGYRRGRKM